MGKRVCITEHAVERYIERIDPTATRDKANVLLNDMAERALNRIRRLTNLSGQCFRMRVDGCILVISFVPDELPTVITVIRKDMNGHWERKKMRRPSRKY